MPAAPARGRRRPVRPRAPYGASDSPIANEGHPGLPCLDMLTAGQAEIPSRRPRLLALVFGVVLVIVGVTASALVALTSAHVTAESLAVVVRRDAALARYVVTDLLDSVDLIPGRASHSRVSRSRAGLAALTDADGLVRIEVRSLDARVLFSDAAEVVGTTAARSAGMTEAVAGRPSASLIEEGTRSAPRAPSSASRAPSRSTSRS